MPDADGELRVVGLGGGVAWDGLDGLVRELRTSPHIAVIAIASPAPVGGDSHAAAVLASTAALEAGRLYIVPPDRDAVVVGRTLHLVEPRYPRAPIDRMFRSLADQHGPAAIAVVLAGEGADGTSGLRLINECGGLTIVQSPEDATARDMPRNAIDAGSVDIVLPMREIGPQILRFVDSPDGPLAAADEHALLETLRDILALLRLRTGHDFTNYKRATLLRRLSRRMQVCNSAHADDYLRYLRDHPAEIAQLLRDFLISVTNFFRDPASFAFVAQRVIPQLFVNKAADDQVRIWVAGCATGEEAYTLGMLVAEHANTLDAPPRIQIFATDIDESGLAHGRAGHYLDTIAADVSPERLARFFTRDRTGYTVRKELRELVLFSAHNVLRDPPFSRLDLVSCRNLLIYFDRAAQERALGTFHFALAPDAFLVLGSSESTVSLTSPPRFSAIDGAFPIYVRRSAPVLIPQVAGGGMSTRWQPLSSVPRDASAIPYRREGAISFGDVHHRLVERYVGPSVVVNEQLEIVHSSEGAGAFLQWSSGEPTREILRLVHPSLRLELRSALYGVRQAPFAGELRRVDTTVEGQRRVVELEARAMDLPDLEPGLTLVVFRELDATAEPPPARPPADHSIEPLVRELEDELRRTRDQLRSSVEQYETSLEELKASNEELHAINEELRSATEELETSKEELQSVNEELSTVNLELNLKVDEITRANNDVQNLITSTDIGVIFLDRALHIQRFTERARDLVNVIPSDLGRPLAHLTTRFAGVDLPAAAAEVLETGRNLERELVTVDRRRYLARLRPYRSIEDQVHGVVLTFFDVTELKQVETELRVSEAQFRLAISIAPIVITRQDAAGRYTWGFANGAPISFVGATDAALLPAAEALALAEVKREVVSTRRAHRIERTLTLDGVARWYELHLSPLVEPGGVMMVGLDISAAKAHEAELRQASDRKDQFLATLAHELRSPLSPLRSSLDVMALVPPDDTETIAQARALMDRQLTHLVRLVDDLMDLARISRDRLELRVAPTDLGSVIHAAIEGVQPALDHARHRLHVELGTERIALIGDYSRLAQVFGNLLSNAIKYTSAGGELFVTATLDGPWAVVSVRDTGCGISAEVMPHLFDMFTQARDTLPQSQGGLGIGLNLVMRIVELHGGTVTAASAGPGQGSTFTVRLPIGTDA